MAPSNPEFPPRLAHAEGPAAALIQRALAEPMPGPSEQQSWRKLQGRSASRGPRWALPAVALGFSVVALLVWWGRPSPAPSLAPDSWLPRSATALPPVSAVASSEEKAEEPPPTASERPKSSSNGLPGRDSGQCGKLAKAGQYQAAAACYGRASRGSSMASELALYEKARLEAKALGQSSVALATLDEHARRFPGGVLTSEVALTRIELLSQLGRRAEALSAIEQSLQGALGRERGGDLQVLRAQLFGEQGECGAALEAARLARQAGVHPSRIEATERRCSPPAAASTAAQEGANSAPSTGAP
jgi:tetratricopeptide (TPR) repeat protein